MKGFLFVILMIVGAAASCIIISPTLLLIWIPSMRIIKFRRSYVCMISAIYFSYASALLHYLCGIRICIYSKYPEIFTDRGIFIISNHRTRIDWMFAGWAYGTLVGIIPDLVLVLKDSLRSIPIFGWAMQLMLYIFVSRKRDADLPRISRLLSYLLQCGPKPSILLFPEGTDLSDSNVEKSNSYAKSKGLSEFRQVLYPHPSGFICCMSALRGQGMILHDMTVAFKDFTPGRRTSEVDMATGRFPKEVLICVDRYPIDDLPTDSQALKEWLRASFANKEQLLTQHYATKSPTNRKRTGSSPLWPPLLCKFTPSPLPLLVVSLWVVLLAIALMSVEILKWTVAGLVIVFTVVSRALGGFDGIELALHGFMVLDAHRILSS